MNIKCYDNGGETADRYTVVFLDEPEPGKPGIFACLGMGETPLHPQGVCMSGIAQLGRHLGRVIKFTDLPKDCQTVVRRCLS